MKISAPVIATSPRPPAPAAAEPPATPTQPEDTLAAPVETTREQRVVHFLQNVTRSSLEHLRYLSTIYAWNMVGTTVGALSFTPLGIHLAHENAAVVGGVAIGGAVATGGLAALGGYLLERKKGDAHLDPTNRGARPTTGVGDTALSLATTLRALPRFIYPTVQGATEAERQLIYNTLDKLPLKDVTASSVMDVIPGLADTGISGMSQPGLAVNRIILDRGYLASPTFGPELVIHEQGHAVDYAGGYGLLGALNWRGPFGSGPFVSSYAGGNRYEDWAESYHAYQTDRENFRLNFPEKFKVIDEAQHRTPSEALLERPAVREAGRKAGNALSAVPHLRTALEVAGALLSPIQMHRGAKALEAGLVNGDDSQRLQGKMNLMTGLLLGLPGGAPFALATSVTNQALQKYAGDDPSKLEVANKLANGLMAVTTGPFGMAALALRGELAKEGIDIDQVGKMPAADDRIITAPTMLRGLISTVGGAIGGSLLGVTVGTSLAGPAGAAMGAFWGRLAGGATGLGAYGFWHARHKPKEEPSPLDLTHSDKVFLGKILGTTAVGAAAGSVGGFMLGGTAGNLVGTALGGAVGGSVGGWLGAVVGLLGGSYALARGGAFLGRQWAGPESEARVSPPGGPATPPPGPAPSAPAPETPA